jgi:hypothetical protein
MLMLHRRATGLELELLQRRGRRGGGGKAREGTPHPLVAAPPREELLSEYDDTDTSSLFSLVRSESSTSDLIM